MNNYTQYHTKNANTYIQFITSGLYIYIYVDLIDSMCVYIYAGSHTIGTSHCSSFNDRIYNFTGKGDSDPTLDSDYIVKLKQKCKPGDQTTLVEMDPGSFKTFDKNYYTLVSKRRGLFESDSALLNDSKTRTYLKHQADHFKSSFFQDFGISMVKMGRIGVLTGSAGEIRKVCSRIN